MTSKEGFSVVAPIRVMVPALDVGEEGILLRLVEAVDLVHEQDGALPRPGRAAPRLADDGPDLLDPGRHGGEGDEGGADMPGDERGERGLAGARRPPEDHRGEVARTRARRGGAGHRRGGAPGRRTRRGCVAASDRRAAPPRPGAWSPGSPAGCRPPPGAPAAHRDCSPLGRPPGSRTAPRVLALGSGCHTAKGRPSVPAAHGATAGGRGGTTRRQSAASRGSPGGRGARPGRPLPAGPAPRGPSRRR